MFLVSVPVGIAGTVWAYLMLKESGATTPGQKLDLPGVLSFGAGLVVLLVAPNYGMMPSGGKVMSWTSLPVLGGIALGIALGIGLLAAFVLVERRTRYPMFKLEFFRIRMFAAGNASNFLYAVAQGGLQFMLIIWLQGVWLPLHGSRGLSTAGLVVMTAGLLLLMLLPANFSYLPFMLIPVLVGIGMGLFTSPNMTAVMNSVPPEYRGVASGMRATLQSAGMLISMTLFFSVVIVGLARNLPPALYSGLVAAGIPEAAALQASKLPPTGALFAAFLGYNPMQQILPQALLASLPEATRSLVLGKTFFPSLMAGAFMDSLRLAFFGAAALALLAAVASFLRGKTYIHDIHDIHA